MPRRPGVPNRNFPPLVLSEALLVPRKIEDEASGTTVSRLTMAEILSVSPSSSRFRELIGAARLYRLSSGGVNADEFASTPLGAQVAGGDEVAVAEGLKKAVRNVAPFDKFLVTFNNKKVPSAVVLKEFLVNQAEVAPGHVDNCVEHLLADAEFAGFLRMTKGGRYVDFGGEPVAFSGHDDDGETDSSEDVEDEEIEGSPDVETVVEPPTPAAPPAEPAVPKKVFIAHGKNRVPLEQLKKALDTFKVKYAVAVDEPSKGRPISKKVASLMRDECSSGIFIFTADERFFKEVEGGEPEEVWRPSENVVFELGAASILYENRIVIFKESDVEFPSDFSDLGYIEFEKDQLATEIGSLFSELVALDILEVRAKG